MEWRARWLEARLRDLAAQQSHYQIQAARFHCGRAPLQSMDDAAAATQQLGDGAGVGAAGADLVAESQTGEPVAAAAAQLQQVAEGVQTIATSVLTGDSCPGAAVAAAEAVTLHTDEHEGAAQAAAEPEQKRQQGQAGAGMHWRRSERLQARELQAEHLLDHALFAALAGVHCRRHEVFSQEGSDDEEDALPAAAFAALELCQRHLAAVRGQLTQVCIGIVVSAGASRFRAHY